MPDQKTDEISRRTFVRNSGLVAGGMLLGSAPAATGFADPAIDAPASPSGDLEKRVLGRTNAKVTTVALGTAPCGLCPDIHPPQIARIVTLALDLGVTFIDTAPAYREAEEGVGMALGQRRKDVFLATKVLADTLDEAEKSLTNSFRLLKTGCFDLVYYHSAGDHDIEKAMAPDGVFSWLVKQKKAGKFRFLGISGHNRPGKFLPLLQSGEVDVLMTLVNFVDRYTYRFDDEVLPLARKMNVGLVAMKVFGGARNSGYANPSSPPQLDTQHLNMAVRYALGVPGVAAVNLGVHNQDQLRQNVEMVRNYQSLSDDEQTHLVAWGKRLAPNWQERFGPVA